MKQKLFVGEAKMMALAVTLGIGVSGQAAAASYSAGVVGATPYVNFASIAGASVSFADTYTFDIPLGLHAGALSLQNHPLSFHTPFSLSVLDIGGLSMDIYDSSNILVAGSVASYSGVLTSGSYSVNVFGLTSGISGGAYSLAIAAVPEANTWVMMLAGLGMVGIAMFRRRATRT